jgi:hypothetical protein
VTGATVLEGPEAEVKVADALAIVADVLPYLRASATLTDIAATPGTIPEDGDWLLCDELVADPIWLETTIRGAGRSLGTTSAPVAASLFVLGYSYRVLTLAVSCLVMTGVVPGSDAGSMAVALSKGRPCVFAYRHPKALVGDTDGQRDRMRPPVAAAAAAAAPAPEAITFIVEEAIERHLRLLADAVTERIGVGRRLLWGNVAASAAVAFRTMEGLRGEQVKEYAEKFFAVVPEEMKGQGNFLTLEHDGRRGWFWERRKCCLNDRLPQHIRCRDCSLTPADQRRATYLADLASV